MKKKDIFVHRRKKNTIKMEKYYQIRFVNLCLITLQSRACLSIPNEIYTTKPLPKAWQCWQIEVVLETNGRAFAFAFYPFFSVTTSANTMLDESKQTMLICVLTRRGFCVLSSNPNEPVEPESPALHAGRAERNRFKNIEWTAYEAVHKKYLSIGKLLLLLLW